MANKTTVFYLGYCATAQSAQVINDNSPTIDDNPTPQRSEVNKEVVNDKPTVQNNYINMYGNLSGGMRI